MTIRIHRWTVGAMLLVAAATMHARSASAQSCGTGNGCPGGSVCLWKHDNFRSPATSLGASDDNYNDNRFSDGSKVNDEVTSLCNYTTSCVRFFFHNQGDNGGFLSFGLKPGWCEPDLSNNQKCDLRQCYWFNDVLSSHRPTQQQGAACTLVVLH